MSQEPLAIEAIAADLLVKRYDEYTALVQDTGGGARDRVVIPDAYAAAVVQFLDAHATPSLAETIGADGATPFAAADYGERALESRPQVEPIGDVE